MSAVIAAVVENVMTRGGEIKQPAFALAVGQIWCGMVFLLAKRLLRNPRLDGGRLRKSVVRRAYHGRCGRE